jgi:hypothetical protein
MRFDVPLPCLVVLIGPSGSGKTTWARQHFEEGEIVSSDALRAMVGAGEDDQVAGTAAFDVLERIVSERMKRGITTVVDTLGFDREPGGCRWPMRMVFPLTRLSSRPTATSPRSAMPNAGDPSPRRSWDGSTPVSRR